MIVAVADTHCILWQIYSDPRLSKTAQLFIENTAMRGDSIGISTITLVEMVYLIEKRRIAVESLSRLVKEIRQPGSVFIEITLNQDIARTLSLVDVNSIPDMPDRIIAATGLHLNVPIISRDHKIQLSSVATIW